MCTELLAVLALAVAIVTAAAPPQSNCVHTPIYLFGYVPAKWASTMANIIAR